MADNSVFVTDLGAILPAFTPNTITSRKLFADDKLKAVLFGFAAGESLSEHTAASPAILHFLSGQAQLTLDDVEQQAGPGTWVQMPAHLPHSVYAETDVTMLLLLLP